MGTVYVTTLINERKRRMRLGSITRFVVAGAVALTTLTAMSSTAVAAPATPAPAVTSEQGTFASAVDGTFGDGGTVTGTFTPTEFAVQDDTLVATGVLHSVLTNADGSSAGTTDSTVTLPVQLPGSGETAALITCNVLHLVLGPLNLNLLGLNVHLNTVVLDITAIPGAGNLLGNLLCALVGLLDGTGLLPLGQIAALLNQILALLNL
jgi:hypothetical protein